MGVTPAAALTERRLKASTPPFSSSSSAQLTSRSRVLMYTLYTSRPWPGSTALWHTVRPMQIDLQTENVAKLIQLALGPVFLISGVGITLSMLTQRLARIVDRARTLEDRRENTADEKRLAHIDEDLRFIVRRTRYINSAIALSTTAGLL